MLMAKNNQPGSDLSVKRLLVSLTAHEIGLLQTRLGTIDSEEKFSAFVNEAERAFSREHTQWVARQIDSAP